MKNLSAGIAIIEQGEDCGTLRILDRVSYVWGTRLSRYCHVVNGVWYIYDCDTGSLVLM